MTPEHIAAAKHWIELNGLQPQAPACPHRPEPARDLIPTALPPSPLLWHVGMSVAAKRRLSRESAQRLEPKLRCEIHVQDRSGEQIVGVVDFFERRADALEVLCGWHRTAEVAFPTLLCVALRASGWDQLFLFVLALTGELALEGFPSLNAGQWRTVRLQMPDVEGTDVDDKVTVTVDADSWVAVLASTRNASDATELVVPEELRQQNIGRLLVEMASRLLLGGPR